MPLQNILLQQRAAIVSRWYQRILDSYPVETARFLKRVSDGFRNPVGQTIAPAVDQLFEAILSGQDHQALAAPLDSIIRIRSVQDFSASEAVRFVFDLKSVIRDAISAQTSGADRSTAAHATGGTTSTNGRTTTGTTTIAAPSEGDANLLSQLEALEARIDVVGLLAFDIYMQCREQIYELRANEQRRQNALLIERAWGSVSARGRGNQDPVRQEQAVEQTTKGTAKGTMAEMSSADIESVSEQPPPRA